MGFDLLSLLVVILLAAIAYFHWVQGLLSGLISAVCAICAATLAISYHEPLIETVLGGKLADLATAVTLVALFVIIYGLLRVVFDKFVPGNVRVPALADSIGGAVFGLIAGVFALGTVAIAAQSMPFGPRAAGHSRYELADRMVILVNARQRQVDADVLDEVTNGQFDAAKGQFVAEKAGGLWIPVDSMVVSATRGLSAGSLEGSQRFGDVYPDLLDELQGQRLGIDPGAKQTALNIGNFKQVSLQGAYVPPAKPPLPQVDGEIAPTRNRSGRNMEPLPKTYSPEHDNLLIVRLTFNNEAADKDGKVRFTCASVPLIVAGDPAKDTPGKMYFPIGSLSGGVLVRHSIDDPLFAPSGASVDLVYDIPAADYVGEAAAANQPAKMKRNVLIRAKRFGRLDLGGRDLVAALPPATDKGLIYKKDVVTEIQKAAGAAPAAAPTPGAAESPAATPAPPAPGRPATPGRSGPGGIIPDVGPDRGVPQQ
jgi:hypothetical protein